MSRIAVLALCAVALLSLYSGADEPRPVSPRETGRLVVNSGHAGVMTGGGMSGNGALLATTSVLGEVRVWDVASGRVMAGFQTPGRVFVPVLNRDGSRLAVFGEDLRVRVWDTRSGAALAEFPFQLPAESELLASFSPDGRQLAIIDGGDALRIHSVETGQPQYSHRLSGILAMDYAPEDGQILVLEPGNRVRALAVDTGKSLRTLQIPGPPATSLVVNGPGNRVIVGHGKEAVSVLLFPDYKIGRSDELNLPDREKTSGHPFWIAPGGRMGYSVYDGPVFFDLRSARYLKRLPRASPSVTNVRFADQNLLVTLSSNGNSAASRDNAVRVWRLDEARSDVLQGGQNAVMGFAMTEDGTRYAFSERQAPAQPGGPNPDVQGYIAQGNEKPTAFTARGEHFKFGRSGKLLANYGQDIFSPGAPLGPIEIRGHLSIIDAVDGRLLRTLFGRDALNDRIIYDVAFSPDDRWIASAGNRIPDPVQNGQGGSRAPGTPASNSLHGVRIWEVETGKLLAVLNTVTVATAIAISPDGRYLAAGCADATRLWDLSRGFDSEPRLLKFGDDLEHPAGTVSFSRDGRLLAAGREGHIQVWEFPSLRPHADLEQPSAVRSLDFSPRGDRLAVGTYDGACRVWDLEQKLERLALVGLGDESAFITPEQYYSATSGAFRHISFQVGLRAYSYEHFDLLLNRPDKVLEAVGAPAERILLYRTLSQRRARNHGGLSEVSLGEPLPQISMPASDRVISTKQRSHALRIHAQDPRQPLRQINIFVNDVPIHGKDGLSLTANASREYSGVVDIPLIRGQNHVQISAVNQAGVEGLREELEIRCTAEARKPDLYLVSVGVSQYRDPSFNLEFAAKDAADVAQLFTGSPTRFSQVKTLLLQDGKATRQALLGTKAMLQRTRPEDHVILFLSGHGVLDRDTTYYFAPHDFDLDRVAASGVSYEMLESLLDGIPARHKLMLLDSCHAGELDKDEADALLSTSVENGIVVRPGRRSLRVTVKAAISPSLRLDLMRRLFVDLRRGSGAHMIGASAGVQLAREEAGLRNGLFTYVLRQALEQNAADRDGMDGVSVSELREYLYAEVERRSSKLQMPASRHDGIQFDFPVR